MDLAERLVEKLDSILPKPVGHQPTLIRDGVNPPYLD